MIPVKHFGVALYPFKGGLVLTKLPAFTAQDLLPVSPDLVALGFHALQKGVCGFTFTFLFQTLRQSVPPSTPPHLTLIDSSICLPGHLPPPRIVNNRTKKTKLSGLERPIRARPPGNRSETTARYRPLRLVLTAQPYPISGWPGLAVFLRAARHRGKQPFRPGACRLIRSGYDPVGNCRQQCYSHAR